MKMPKFAEKSGFSGKTFALITQRSLVQIQPPLPIKQKGWSFDRPFCFIGSVVRYESCQSRQRD